MHRTLTLILAVAVAANAGQASAEIKRRMLAIAEGAPVEVRLADDGRLRGRLRALSDEDFELQTIYQGRLGTQRIRFDKTKSVRDLSCRLPVPDS